jgi:hypothetical protein
MPFIQCKGSNITPVPINKPHFHNRALDPIKLHSMPHSTVFFGQGSRSSANKYLHSTNSRVLHPHNNLLLLPIFSPVNHVHAIPSNSYKINFNTPNLRFTLHKLYPFLLVSPTPPKSCRNISPPCMPFPLAARFDCRSVLRAAQTA